MRSRSRSAAVACLGALALALAMTAPARGQDSLQDSLHDSLQDSLHDSPDPWWGRDKALHFGVSATLAGGAYGGAALFTPRTEGRLAVGAAVALSAGVAKELVDLSGRGDASWRDLTWDVVGTATGLLVAWTIDRLLSPPAPVH